ncbi:MAG: 2-hydroxychromene-2-carboxylate isomerase [Xanthomonadaceae bacterium]|nr:2-hydroxychromene-2-carboxylate isomerase [Xanthomonadaceae bacterium]
MNDTTVRWYFDILSPFAYLQWPKVKAAMAEYRIQPVPILLAAVLDTRGQKGPAEIPSKREFTYRHALWQARRAGMPLRFPPSHPFNPLPALRLTIAAGASVAAIDAVFDWIWAQGRAADSAEAVLPLCAALQVDPALLAHDKVKTTLRENTEAALRAGVFGVPTLAVDNDDGGVDLFWGNDAHEFALDALRDPALLRDPEMRRLSGLPVGVRRG